MGRSLLTPRLSAIFSRRRTLRSRTATEAHVARAETQLGVLLAQAGRREDAAAHWRAVVARLQIHADKGDLPALTALATAQFHLGAIAESRALVSRIASTTYRHPAYAVLVKLLSDGAGPSLAKP